MAEMYGQLAIVNKTVISQRNRVVDEEPARKIRQLIEKLLPDDPIRKVYVLRALVWYE